MATRDRAVDFVNYTGFYAYINGSDNHPTFTVQAGAGLAYVYSISFFMPCAY
jgi:hypothetical protein